MNYDDLLLHIEKDLRFFIPTLGLKSLFVAKLDNDKIRIKSISGREYILSEEDFVSAYNRFSDLPSNSKFNYGNYRELKHKSTYIIAILRELYVRKLISPTCKDLVLDRYTPLPWDKIIKTIRELQFSDFRKYVSNYVETSGFKRFQKENKCSVCIKEKSIKIYNNNHLCFIFNEDLFDEAKELLIKLLKGNLEELVGLAVYIIRSPANLKDRRYTEAIGEILGRIMGGILGDIGCTLGGILGKHIAKEINKYFKIDEKIDKVVQKIKKDLH